MDKVKIQDVAAEVGLSNAEVLDKAIELGFAAKVASSSISMENAEVLFNYIVTGELPSGFSKPVQKEAKSSVAKTEDESTEIAEVNEEPVVSEEPVVKAKPKTSNISSSIKVTPKATAQELQDKETNILAGMTIVKQKVQTPSKPVVAVQEVSKKKKLKKTINAKESGARLEIDGRDFMGSGFELFDEQE